MDEQTNPQPTTVMWTSEQEKTIADLEYELRRLFLVREIAREKYQIAELNKAIKELNT